MPSAPPARLALSVVLSAGLVALAGFSVARYVTGVGVRSSGTPVVVAFGDSLTEGSGLLARPWPAVLAGRLEGRKGGSPITVVNAGISGNRSCARGSGRAA
jgi:hypothetical protein